MPVKKRVIKTSLEGVYTFKRWIRLSFKLPYFVLSEVNEVNGTAVKTNSAGFGDLAPWLRQDLR